MKTKILLSSLLLAGLTSSAFAEAVKGEWRVIYQNNTDQPLKLQVAQDLPDNLACWITHSLNNAAIITIPAHSSKEVTTSMAYTGDCAPEKNSSWMLKMNLWSDDGFKTNDVITYKASGINDSNNTGSNILGVSHHSTDYLVSSMQVYNFDLTHFESHIDATVIINDNQTDVDSIAAYYPAYPVAPAT